VQPSKPPPEPQQIDLEEYVIGVLPETIRQLRRDNPNRSLRWLAQRTGQPKSYIKEVLGIAGDGAAACAYCGEAIAETKPGAGGRPKRFCSDRCRLAAFRAGQHGTKPSTDGADGEAS
jgi:hypothetical protein